MSKGSNTRSGLLWEVERILNELKESDSLPQVLLMENVQDVIGKKNYKDFMQWYAALEGMGYQSYYKLLNAKNFGIPQNRNRCFMVSILGDYSYEFPKEIPLKLRLKGMLEDEVDEKYYLSKKLIKGFIEHTKKHKEKGNGFLWKPKTGNDIANSLTAHQGFSTSDNSIIDPIVEQIGNCMPTKNRENPNQGRIYDKKGIAPTLSCMQGGNLQPFVIENEGVIVWSTQNNAAISTNGIVPTLTSSMGTGGGHIPMHNYDARIRKLTPLECWRLMGFADEDFRKAEKVNSNSQLYKQAGNSIVKQVLMAIFKEMM